MHGFLDSILIPLARNVFEMRLSRTRRWDIEKETETSGPECKSHRLNRRRKVTTARVAFDIKSPIVPDDSDPWSSYT